VFREKTINHIIADFLLNLNLSHLTTVDGRPTLHIRICIRTFHFVTNRSCCADFYLVNKGPLSSSVMS